MSTTEKNYRIVIMDGNIIAQFQVSGFQSWCTCSKNQNSDDSCFAIWENTPANLQKAKELLEPCLKRNGIAIQDLPVITSSLKPVQLANGYYKNYYTAGWARAQVSYKESLVSLADREDVQRV
jgi:hypothetical protein